MPRPRHPRPPQRNRHLEARSMPKRSRQMIHPSFACSWAFYASEPPVCPRGHSAVNGHLLSLIRTLRFIGVADIASVRFSLPAQLLEPRPNLEYWTYLDQPNTFAAIGDSDDELGRMLEVLRFWYTKDLKYVKGKPCKPYNSILGEFFRVSPLRICRAPVADSLIVQLEGG